MTVIGTDVARLDGIAKLTGKQQYTGDILIPGMMHAVLLRSPHPHAEIIKIDTSEAEKMGAVCLTYDDILINGQAVVYNERSVSVPAATYRDRTILPNKARHLYEPIAAVAADTEELAYKALQAVKVEYRVLQPVYDPQEAMEEGAPQLYDKVYLGDKEVDICNNIGVSRNISQGDVEAGFARADRIFEQDFELPRIYHAQLETKGCVVAPEPDGGITVWATAQSIHGNRQLLGRALNLPLSKINVKKIAIGGAFGSSIQVNTVTPICAALALKARRPVKLISSREEDFYSHQKYPVRFHVKMGVTNEGMITAAELSALVDFGAHQVQPLPFLGCVAGWFASLYQYGGNIGFHGTAVYTNKTPCCAMQGYGNPQTNFAIESMIDIISGEMGFDAIEFRLKNYRGVGHEFWGQGPTIRTIIKSCGVEESLLKGREIMGWSGRGRHTDKQGRIRHGLGVARGFHTSGTGGPKEGEVIDYSSAFIKINEDGSVDVVTPVMDLGGGTWDAIAKFVSEVLQVPLQRVGLSPTDTKSTAYDVCTHATRGVYCGGGAAYHVALEVRKKLLETAGRLLNEHAENLELVRDDDLGQGVVYVKGLRDNQMTVGEIARQAQINSWGTLQYAGSYRQKNCPPCFTTHFVEVAVDTLTGEITIPKVLIYGDCGTVVNPELFGGQLIGSFGRGMAYTLYENLTMNEEGGFTTKPQAASEPIYTSQPVKDGELLNHGALADYKLPTSSEMPLIENVLVRHTDTYEPTGPFGAKGIAESAIASVQAAIANAIYNAIGIRFYRLPITPEIVLQAIQKKAVK
ncbi:MAG: xanthine dehydrogenase family protein molybdopterin-binding subunit [Clostridia bacterium]|nr:xanthine dehydrogenase family protein molybdopterin-binding subunit [Clostridia bacterium]